MNKEVFCKSITSWDNYKPLLFKALKETKGDVIEMGCGNSSTPLLHEYCSKSKRNLHSYDSSEEYFSKFKTLESDFHTLDLISDWSTLFEHHKDASVILVDHAPGEDRGQRLMQWESFKGIAVCHDSEPSPCGGNYGWKFNRWKYVVHVKSKMNGDTNGTWATAVSNHIDLTKWVGEKFGDYEISL